jgi:hypothetical protein
MLRPLLVAVHTDLAALTMIPSCSVLIHIVVRRFVVMIVGSIVVVETLRLLTSPL